MRHAGHPVGLLRHALHRRIPEVVRRQRRVDELGGGAEAADVDRGFREIARALRRGHDQRDAAVIDQAVVEQVQRLGDEARALVILDGDRLLHHGFGIEQRMLAERDRDRRKLPAGRAVEVHVALEHHRMRGARRRHPVGKPRPDPAAAVTVALAAVLVAARLAVVAVDQRDGVGEPGLDRRGGDLDRVARHPSLTGRDQRELRVHAGDLGEALIVRNAVDDQPVDLRAFDAAILHRALERDQAEIIGIVARHGAGRRRADPDHRHPVAQAHAETRSFAVARAPCPRRIAPTRSSVSCASSMVRRITSAQLTTSRTSPTPVPR